MNTQVSPAVLGKLDDFRSRRQRLILSRGVCAGLVSVIVAMMLIAIVDWMFFLSAYARLGLSVTGYTFVAAIVWFTSVRLIWKMPDSSQVARLLETAEPSLREDLVSAVELGDPKSENPWDSPAFRRFLQQNIAHKMTAVNVRSLLPWQLIRRWISFASVAAILFLILLCMPGLHFGRRVARAMMPLANVERVSLTNIEIVSPNPANTAVAQGEEIEVVVRISGPEQVDQVMLETSRDGGETSRVDMTLVAAGQRSYKSTVRMGRESIHYRVWANDARTTKHLLLSRQRPQVTSFVKTFRYPDYLGRETKTETDKVGDLIAVQGTEVDLVVEVNQPVTLAHLTVNSDGGEHIIPLTPNIDAEGRLLNRVRGTLAVSQTGTYSIRLVGAETGLENKFNPEYVIQAVPDAPPTIRIEQPGQAILVPSDEIVKLLAQADDDWGIDRIEQHLRVADGEWTKATIAEPANAVAKKQIARDWDLYPLGLEPGSVVFTKLVAVDRKGSRGESRMIRAVISSHGFDPQRWAGLGEARRVHSELIDLLSSATQLKEAILAANDPQSVVTAIARADAYDAQAAVSLTRVHAALRSADTGQASLDLVRVGQAISQASTVGVGFARNHLATGSYKEAGKAAEFVETRVKSAAESFDHLLRLSESAAISSDLMSLRKMYREAIERGGPASTERISRRVNVIGSEAGVIADFVKAMREHAGDEIETELQSIEDDLRSLKKLGDPFAGPIGMDAVRSADQPLESALSRSVSLFRRGLLDSHSPRQQLLTAAGTTDAPTFRAARFARNLHDMKASLGQQAARGELDRLQHDAEQTKRTRELSTASFDAAVSGLMTLATLERNRTDGDSRFVADTSRAWRAIETIRLRTSEGGPKETQAIDDLDRLASAVRVLNLVHQSDDLISVVSQISESDSVSSNSSSILRNPQEWFGAESQYQSLLDRLRKAGISRQAAQLLNESRRREAYQLVRKEMSSRPQLDRGIEVRPAELSELLSDLRRVRALLQEPLDEARADFQKLSPRIDQMLADLAREVRDDADEFSAWLDQDELTEEELDEQANQQLDEMKLLAEQLEEVREALREDAAEQDVLGEEGRERMRDDDDALAMLDEQPRPIDEALEQAIQREDFAEQQAALAEAARQQAELAERLEQLAEHFENLERDEAEASRQALRESELETGVRDRLEAQQQQLEQLAQLAELPAEEALAALEHELENNRPMQRELDTLTREQLEQAQSQLAAAAQQQQQRADTVAQQNDRAESMREWSEQLSQIGRDAQGLNANQVADAQEAAAEQAANAEQEESIPTEIEDTEIEDTVAEDDPSDVWEDLEQQQIAEAIAEVQQDLEQAARNQQRLGNEENAEQIQQIAEEAQQATELIQENQQRAAQSSTAQNEPNGQPQAPGDLSEQLQEVQQAINEPAEQLEDFLAGEEVFAADDALEEFAANDTQPGLDPVAGEFGAEPSSEFGSEPTSEPAASEGPSEPGSEPGQPSSEPGQPSSEPGQPSSEPGQPSSEPGQPSSESGQPSDATPSLSQSAARQLAEALHELDSELLGQQSQPSASSEASGSESAGENASESSGQASESASPGQQASQSSSETSGESSSQSPGQSEASNPSGQAASSPIAEAIAAAAQAQSQQISAGRSSAAQPSSSPVGQGYAEISGGAGVEGGPTAIGALPPIDQMKQADWAKLPPKLARELLEGRREKVSPQYRQAVETYFRLVAEKAKEN